MGKKYAVYIGSFDLPDRNAAAHRVMNNARCLKSLNIDTIFLGIMQDKKYTSKNMVSYKYESFDIFQTGKPCTVRDWITYKKEVITFVNNLLKKHDIEFIICYNLKSSILKEMQKICKKKGIEIIGDITEWYQYSDTNKVKELIKNIDSNYRMKILNKKMDGLIVISDYLYNYYYKYSKIIKIPPLINLDDFYLDYKYDLLNKEKINIVFCGTLGSNKDKFDDFIENEYLNDIIEIHIIGISRDEYLKEKPFMKNKVDNNVYFYGKISHEKALKYVSEADYTILFRENNRSNKAGFSTKLVESITYNTPVLSNCMEQYNDLNKYFVNYIPNREIFQKKIVTRKLNQEFDYTRYIDEFKKIFKKRIHQ